MSLAAYLKRRRKGHPPLSRTHRERERELRRRMAEIRLPPDDPLRKIVEAALACQTPPTTPPLRLRTVILAVVAGGVLAAALALGGAWALWRYDQQAVFREAAAYRALVGRYQALPQDLRQIAWTLLWADEEDKDEN